RRSTSAAGSSTRCRGARRHAPPRPRLRADAATPHVRPRPAKPACSLRSWNWWLPRISGLRRSPLQSTRPTHPVARNNKRNPRHSRRLALAATHPAAMSRPRAPLAACARARGRKRPRAPVPEAGRSRSGCWRRTPAPSAHASYPCEPEAAVVEVRPGMATVASMPAREPRRPKCLVMQRSRMIALAMMEFCIHLADARIVRHQALGFAQRRARGAKLTESDVMISAIQPGAAQPMAHRSRGRIARIELLQRAQHVVRLVEIVLAQGALELLARDLRQVAQPRLRLGIVAVDAERGAIQIVRTVARRQHDVAIARGGLGVSDQPRELGRIGRA